MDYDRETKREKLAKQYGAIEYSHYWARFNGKSQARDFMNALWNNYNLVSTMTYNCGDYVVNNYK